MTTSPDVDVVVKAGAILGEGPGWIDESLWWVDVEGRSIHRTNPETGEDALWTTDGPVGSVIPRAGGRWTAGMSELCDLLKRYGLGVEVETRTIEEVTVRPEFFDTL